MNKFLIVMYYGYSFFTYTDPNISFKNYNEFFITRDLSYAEFFQYFKYLVICGITSYIIILKKNYSYIPWLLLFLILFLDDAFQLHESLAILFIDFFNLEPALGLRQQDIGELAYSAFVGSILLFTIVVSYITSHVIFKKTNLDISLLFSVFLFFGIVVDMAHSLVNKIPLLDYTIGLIEDGGEMIVLSLLTWYFSHIVFRPNESDTFLYEFLYKKKSSF
ncbi:MAG: hypothetical protein P8K68_12320 [Algibacter sp.]|uniref:hypothetical protein n=1 Tax=Algibacter sp. TaxID=1872428 RepID=UPI00262756FE|nr:hypothetical protein [Algibacter sp.]MDG1730418.1 hypothetical protein [Algibacter sp.]MDG2179551.1 hypothetical protein [Algibacter sp.]